MPGGIEMGGVTGGTKKLGFCLCVDLGGGTTGPNGASVDWGS